MTTILNPDQPSIRQDVGAILDLGSQHSYITQQAAQTLQLMLERVHEMSIFTFRSSWKTLSDCSLVHVLMKTLDGGMNLHLLTTPVICKPLTAQPLDLCVNSYEHLSAGP